PAGRHAGWSRSTTCDGSRPTGSSPSDGPWLAPSAAVLALRLVPHRLKGKAREAAGKDGRQGEVAGENKYGVDLSLTGSLFNGFEGFLGPFGDVFVPLVNAKLHGVQAAAARADTAAILDDFRDHPAKTVLEPDPVTDTELAGGFVRDAQPRVHSVSSTSYQGRTPVKACRRLRSTGKRVFIPQWTPIASLRGLLLDGFEGFLGQFSGFFVPFVEAELHGVQAAAAHADAAAVLDDFGNHATEPMQ